LTAAVIKEFIGNIDDDKMMNTAMFLRARLCDMTRVKEYQCFMQKLYYSSGNINDETMRLR
ncbi:hypothetical protein KI387_024739, partial [Taxus chinensis]